MTLEFRTERINDVVTYIVRIPQKRLPVHPLFMSYVEESWVLHFFQVAGGMNTSNQVGTGGQFKWECSFLRCRYLSTGSLFFDDENLQSLASGWADPANPRIRRTTTVGEKYYLNTKWPAWAFFPPIKWESILPAIRGGENLPLRKVSPQIDRSSVFRALEFSCKPSVDLSFKSPLIDQFVAFCRSVLHTEVALLEWRQGLLLFSDNNEENTHLLVKIAGVPYSTRGYFGGTFEYLDLFVKLTGSTRIFVLTVDKGVAEMSAGWVSSFLRGEGYGDLESLMNIVLQLRNQDLLNVNLLFGDIFSPRASLGGGTTTLDAIISAWDYIPARNMFELSLSPDRIDLAREVMKKASAPQVPVDPIDEFMFELELREKHPDLHAQLVKELAAKQKESEDEEEEPESELARELQYLEEEANKSTAVPMHVIKEDDERIYWAGPDGKRLYSELKETEEDYYGTDEELEDEEFDLEDEEGVDDTDYEDDEEEYG